MAGMAVAYGEALALLRKMASSKSVPKIISVSTSLEVLINTES